MEITGTLEDALREQIRDLYDAETQIAKKMPNIVTRLVSKEFKDGMSAHVKDTEQQLIRLKKIANTLDFDPTGKKCKAMQSFFVESREIIANNANPKLIDTLLITLARHIEHYKILGYGTAKALAQNLGFSEIVDLLQRSFLEEESAEKKLAQTFDEMILQQDTRTQDKVDTLRKVIGAP